MSRSSAASVPPATQTRKSARGKKPGGGTATGGGINFQAAVTAIAGVHLLRGTAIGWLPVSDVPTAIWAESEGPGDDLRLELASGASAEVQAKKGLNRAKPMWEALEALVKAIQSGRLDYGVLAIAPDSSRTVREDLAIDLDRLGQGRVDSLTEIGKELHQRLQVVGGDWQEACRHVVIRVVHALETDAADIRAAKEVLRWICAKDSDAEIAWNAIYQDALLRIENRGRWTMPHLLHVLQKAGVSVRDADFPASIAQKLADWVGQTNKDFTLPAARQPLPLNALIAMRTVGMAVDPTELVDAAAALARYHSGPASLDRDAPVFDAEWTGQFRRCAVIVAGPGLGKSTLMRLLASRYAADGLPVLGIKLKSAAAAMERGESFESVLRSHALDGSGIAPDQFERAKLSNLVILADGLDDCGAGHDTVARAIHAFALGHPSARIIVTTRPIGYATAAFADWQHYRLLAPDKGHGAANLAKLLAAVQEADPSDAKSAKDTLDRARRELARSRASDAISTSPLLIGMAAAVIAAKGQLPDTRPQLYAELIGLFETSRGTQSRTVAASIATRVLNALGWLLMQDPLMSAAHLSGRLAEELGGLLGCTALAAAETVEQAMAYWEQIGVIEQLHHGGVAYWTFVHKTFTEFAAARRLMTLSESERKGELDRMVDDPDWHEVVAFAGGLGLGDEIAKLFVDRRAAGSAGQMERALALAGDPDARVTDEQVEQLAELGFAAVESSGADRFSIGVALADLARARPSTIGPIASARREHANNSVRLVAWACLVEAAPGSHDSRELSDALTDLLPTISWSTHRPLFGGIRLGGKQDRDLIGRIALAALEGQSDGSLKEFAETRLNHEVFQSIRFRMQVEAVFRARGVDGPAPLPWERSLSRSTLGLISGRDDWDFSSAQAMRALAGAAVAGPISLAEEQEPSSFPQFGALVALSGFDEVPAYDVHNWTRAYDPKPVRAVVQAVIQASTIDPQALRVEALAVVGLVGTAEKRRNLWLELPQVDVPHPDWARAASLIPDKAILVAAMNHGSQWLTYLAGNILAASSATAEESRELLDHARGSALWAAVEVVREQQPIEIANVLILGRLGGTLSDGSEHLFKALERGGIDPSPALSDAIRDGLATSLGEVAQAAAGLAKDLAARGKPVASEILLKGYDHWKQTEPEFRGGVIPPSPRETLMNLLIAEGAFDDEHLLAALSDSRSDVRSAAEAHMLAALPKSEPLRNAAIARVISRDFPAGIAARLIATEPPLTADQVAELENLLHDPAAKWRLAGVELLRPKYLQPEQIAAHIFRLAGDDEEEIREAVAGLQADVAD